jgi:protein-L-isoaspartate O-methyltransferase
LIFLQPIPANLGDYYPPSYYGLAANPEALKPAYQYTDGYKIDILNQYTKGQRLLEVGPGAGGFAYLAKEAGYHPIVMEMDEAVCQYIQEAMGIQTIHSTDISLGINGLGQFDVIALWHVIEHIPRFWEVLPALIDHLGPDGILILASPNPDALQLKVFHRFWAHLDAPRHIYLIPLDLLVTIGQRYQLTTIDRTTLDPGSLAWNGFGWQWSMRNITSSQAWIVQKWASVCHRLARPFERRGESGATYTLILRKPAL